VTCKGCWQFVKAVDSWWLVAGGLRSRLTAGGWWWLVVTVSGVCRL